MYLFFGLLTSADNLRALRLSIPVVSLHFKLIKVYHHQTLPVKSHQTNVPAQKQTLSKGTVSYSPVVSYAS
jgi:hypothetical protein